MKLMKVALIVGVTAVPVIGLADVQRDVCDRQAREISGYDAFGGLSVTTGNVTARLSGSVAVGVSRSRGPENPKAPAFAGSSSVERREAQARERYDAALKACLAGL